MNINLDGKNNPLQVLRGLPGAVGGAPLLHRARGHGACRSTGMVNAGMATAIRHMVFI